MTKHFLYKNLKSPGAAFRHNMHLKIHIKNMLTIRYKQQSCNASFFNISIHVPGVYYCQKYASVSHQKPANQKSIQLSLFRQYTHCYQHSTKGRLNYGPQSFETCLYNLFDTHEALHHDTIFNHRIDILPYRYVSQIRFLAIFGLYHVPLDTCTF